MALAKRRYPIGAELIGENKTHFRVWAPKAQHVDLVLEESAAKNAKRTFHPLEAEEGGYFSGVASAGAGACYRFRVNKAENFHPDPASRFQPDGPHGSSCVVDPTTFEWTDSQWPGVKLKGQIIYEMHVGTFTREGTWRAAAEQLAELARIGITVIEMMPIADFPGKFGWGYDGVDLFAPTRLYGTPDDLRAFVNRAHSLGLGVILDVVYNHFGPDGNYLGVYSNSYLTREKENDWGDSINFDGPDSEPVREFFITNGRYWIEEFHFDGFRFDATQSILDNSDEYIVGAIGRAARNAAGRRSIILVAENERQEAKLIRHAAKAATTSTQCGTTIFITAPLSHSRENEKPITRTTSVHRRNSFRRRSTVIFFKVNPTSGRKRRAARRRLERHRKRSSRSSRITIRFQTPPRVSGFVSKPPLAAIAP